MDNIIKRIYDHYDEFTVSKRAVADYILNSFKYITYDTLTELADKVDVSTTSIIRFAQDLGYSGYSEMLEAIRDYTNLDDPYTAKKKFFQDRRGRAIPDLPTDHRPGHKQLKSDYGGLA